MRVATKKDDLKRDLQSVIAKSIDAGVPGISAAIYSSKENLWHSTAGLVDVETEVPVDENHLFGIGSITKVFVTVVILQLVEEGRLKLNDTVQNLLDPHIYHGVDHAAQATIAGLLSHTAGVDSWEDEPAWIINGRGKQLDPKKIWSKTETLDYVRRHNPSGPKPGNYSYSNTNYSLLGLIVEYITQNTAEAEIRRRVLEPLNMNYTYLEGFESSRGNISPRRYHWNTEQFRNTAGICPQFRQPRDNLIDATGSNLSVEWVAGGFVSYPPDLLTFAIALRDGKLLSSSSLNLMKEWRPVDRKLEMGHGLFRFQGPEGEGKWIGHFGSVLGFNGAWIWKEEGDCTVCVLNNVGTMHAGNVPSSAYELVRNTSFLRLASELADSD